MNFLLHLYTITVYNVEIHKLQFNDKQNKKPTSETRFKGRLRLFNYYLKRHQ